MRHAEPAGRAQSEHVSGPTAPTRVTARALSRVANARAVVLVEGVSDQIALEALAARHRRDLDDEGIVVFPIGGAHAIGRYLDSLGPMGADLRLAGLCDLNEAELFRRSLVRARVGSPESIPEMGHLGFHVCVDDLEDELIRSAGASTVEALFDSEGDLGAFHTLQKQPAWRNRDIAAQMRRFLGSGARRKLRYARLLVRAIPHERMPRPLVAALAHV